MGAPHCSAKKGILFATALRRSSLWTWSPWWIRRGRSWTTSGRWLRKGWLLCGVPTKHVGGFVVGMSKWAKENSGLDWLRLAYLRWLGRIACRICQEPRMTIHQPVERGRVGVFFRGSSGWMTVIIEGEIGISNISEFMWALTMLRPPTRLGATNQWPECSIVNIVIYSVKWVVLYESIELW